MSPREYENTTVCVCVVCERKQESLTIFPLCWADLVSRSVKTFPQTEISLHWPGLESWQKPWRGCITRTPFVVSASICPSCILHLAAFSYEEVKCMFSTFKLKKCYHRKWAVCAFYPKEDVFRRVKACGVNSCRVRWVSLADDAAGKAGDGALKCLTVSLVLTSRHSIRNHKVNGTLCRTANL